MLAQGWPCTRIIQRLGLVGPSFRTFSISHRPFGLIYWEFLVSGRKWLLTKCWCRREILAPLISLMVDKYVAVFCSTITNINTMLGLHFASSQVHTMAN